MTLCSVAMTAADNTDLSQDGGTFFSMGLQMMACVCARKNIYVVAMEMLKFSNTRNCPQWNTLTVYRLYCSPAIVPQEYDLWQCHSDTQIKIKLDRVITAVFYCYRGVLKQIYCQLMVILVHKDTAKHSRAEHITSSNENWQLVTSCVVVRSTGHLILMNVHLYILISYPPVTKSNWSQCGIKMIASLQKCHYQGSKCRSVCHG